MIETKTGFSKGDIVMVFGQPMKLKYPIGQARLVDKISEHDDLEHWHVEFLNDEGRTYPQFIRKLNGEK